MTAGLLLPLLAARDLAAPIAWRDGESLSGAAFLAAAEHLAQRLPASGRPINLCQDRLHFALALAAAWLRGQTSLLPPNMLPQTLRQLPAGAAAPYVLTDDATLDAGTLAVVRVQFGLREHCSTRTETPRPIPTLPADLEAACLLTSGSTGAPQPHAKRFGPLVANIGAEAARLAEFLGRPDLGGLTLVATVPAQHSYGLESSVLLALLGGAALDAGRPFYPADVATALERLPRPRALVTTPFHLKALVRAGVALPPVDLVLSATAPLSPQLAAAAEAAMSATLVEIYGCTEAGQVAARRTTAGDTWTTLGALRIERIAPDVQGEPAEHFVVQGGHVVEPTALADTLVLRDARHFQLLGRANDLIHVAGKRSSLAHLNFHLNRIAGVDDGAFWLPGRGDDEAASAGVESVVRPVAFVVAPHLATREIVAALRRELEPAFVPRRVVKVSALPREATGKLTAQALGAFARLTLAGFTVARSGAEQAVVRHTIAANHASFAGHFPGHPLLPGVVLLSLVMQALDGFPPLRARLGTTPVIEQVKFVAPAGPGTELAIELTAEPGGIGFELRNGGDQLLARGRLGSTA